MLTPLANSFAQSDFFGKTIFIALTLLSISSWVLFIYKMWLSVQFDKLSLIFLRGFKKHEQSPMSFKQFDHQVGASPYGSVYRLLQQSVQSLLRKNKELKPTHEATFLSATDIEQLSSQVEMKIFVEKKAYEKYLFILSTTFSLAPLLGLLGTVWGISVTLDQLPRSANALSNGAVLSSLSMALGTTVYGILVAIPALIFYNYLKSRIESYTVKMNQFSTDLLHKVEIQYRAVDYV